MSINGASFLLEDVSPKEPSYPLDSGLSRRLGVARGEASAGDLAENFTLALSRLPSRSMGCADRFASTLR